MVNREKLQTSRARLSDYLTAQSQIILQLEPALIRSLRSLAGTTPGPRGASQDAAPDAEREGADSTELIHDVRVAIRRLRSTLRTFAVAFDPTEADDLGSEAAWYAGALGRLRDLDIVEPRILSALAAIDPDLSLGDVQSWVENALAADRARCLLELIAIIDGERYARLRASLSRWASAPHWSEDTPVKLRRSVRRAEKQVIRRIERAGSGDTDDRRRRLHQVRKAVKRHRYATELVAPPLDERGTDNRQAELKALQDRLGTIQDSVVSVTYLIGLGTRFGRRSGHNAFSLGALAAAERELQRNSIDAFLAEYA